MPTVLHDGPYRFYFYASDRDEPVHIHVERDDDIAKFWLEPVRLQSSKKGSAAPSSPGCSDWWNSIGNSW